ncbi:MAG: hypothetical protein ABL912_01075 [Novosphingobium sp.]
MPLIRGDTGKGKPIVRVALISAMQSSEPISGSPSGSSLQTIECRALLDTGADGTSVCASVARVAGLRYLGKRPVVGIGGQNYHRTWATRIGFFLDEAAEEIGNPLSSHGNLFVLQEPVLAVQIPDNSWFEIIIGRDILCKGTFIMRPDGSFELDLPNDA